MPKTGVVSIQGDFARHIATIHNAGGEAVEIRTPEELQDVDRLIIPGGESTTVGKLMQRFGLGEAIQAFAQLGKPIWGTCMGMILMAKEIEDSEQYSLALMDITIRRNAFGAQIHSFEDEVDIRALGLKVMGVFIRAPVVTRAGMGVQCLATYDSHVVAVREGNLVGTSFHPELTDDLSLHHWFLGLK